MSFGVPDGLVIVPMRKHHSWPFIFHFLLGYSFYHCCFHGKKINLLMVL